MCSEAGIFQKKNTRLDKMNANPWPIYFQIFECVTSREPKHGTNFVPFFVFVNSLLNVVKMVTQIILSKRELCSVS